MTNLPKSLRDTLAREYPICAPKVVRRQESARDGTIKYLWELSDGNCVETVLMRYHYGNTVCISTEVGCRMGCAFCASTIGGLVRRLEPYEMLDEVLFTQVDSGLPISHIVLMGIGEPLDNFDNVMRFLELVNSPEGMNISMRHISLSHLRAGAEDRRAGEAETAADAVGFPPRAQRRGAGPDHAGEQGLSQRGTAGGLPPVLSGDLPADFL